MLERTHQIKALEAGHRVLTELRRGAMRAALIGGIGDAVQVAAAEARAGALHVHRAVDMRLEHTAWNIADELLEMGEHAISISLLGFIPAAAVRAPVGHIVPQM